MGLMTTLALTAFGAYNAISQGQAANKEAKYNAGLYEQQAGQIELQKNLEASKYDRSKRQLSGSIMARTAKAGFNFSGSPMAVMLDNMTQLELDKAIGQYNLDQQKRYAYSAASEYKRRGQTSLMSGYSNAFSTALMGGFDYGMRSGLIKTPKF